MEVEVEVEVDKCRRSREYSGILYLRKLEGFGLVTVQGEPG